MNYEIDAYRIGWTTHRGWRRNLRHLALPHRPWQAEDRDGRLRFARRALTRKRAVLAVQRDLRHVTGDVTGHPIESPRQLLHTAWRNTRVRRRWEALRDSTYGVPRCARCGRRGSRFGGSANGTITREARGG